MVFGSAEQALEQRNQHGADERHSAARHELLDALRLCAGVVIPVSFQQVDAAPHAQTAAERDHQRLQHVNRGTEKCHGIPPLFFT